LSLRSSLRKPANIAAHEKQQVEDPPAWDVRLEKNGRPSRGENEKEIEREISNFPSTLL
jgi:hypothetical protein